MLSGEILGRVRKAWPKQEQVGGAGGTGQKQEGNGWGERASSQGKGKGKKLSKF